MQEQAVSAAAVRFGRMGADCRHVCVDMQRLFAEKTPWHLPWLERALPQILRIVRHCPRSSIFTRFIPARSPDDREGTWRDYYERWRSMTLEQIDAELLDIVPELRACAPASPVFDKAVYSPWLEPQLDMALRKEGVSTLIVSGGETDVCVLSTVLGAVDRGYRVVVAADALCSASDEAHDASMEVYATRYSQQIEVASVDEILEYWDC